MYKTVKMNFPIDTKTMSKVLQFYGALIITKFKGTHLTKILAKFLSLSVALEFVRKLKQRNVSKEIFKNEKVYEERSTLGQKSK